MELLDLLLVALKGVGVVIYAVGVALAAYGLTWLLLDLFLGGSGTHFIEPGLDLLEERSVPVAGEPVTNPSALDPKFPILEGNDLEFARRREFYRVVRQYGFLKNGRHGKGSFKLVRTFTHVVKFRWLFNYQPRHRHQQHIPSNTVSDPLSADPKRRSVF